jgi:hypothetical protein
VVVQAPVPTVAAWAGPIEMVRVDRKAPTTRKAQTVRRIMPSS